MDRLLTYGSEAEVLLFKRQLRTMTDSIISTQTESAGAWSGDIQFVTNYQAIQSSVQNSYGFIHKKNSAETTPNGRNAQNGKQRSTLDRLTNLNGGSQRSIPAMALGGMGDIGSGVSSVQNGFPFGTKKFQTFLIILNSKIIYVYLFFRLDRKLKSDERLRSRSTFQQFG